jgi:N-acetylmuramoyl-L-alanine amidase
VIDPGHGGDDDGVHGVAGAKEKDIVLQIARRLKAAIEARLQMKVLLTRDGDETVTIDTRAVFANTSKADLFLSLHANASVRPALRGTEVLTLSADDYTDPPATPVKGKPLPAAPPPATVPAVSGGMRLIEPVRWDLAQLPFVDRSAMFSATLVKRLTERAIPSNTPLASTAPLRVLVGANMPAVLIELGFLTNAEDEAALAGTDGASAIIEAILDTIGDVRFGFPSTAGLRVK